MAKIAGSGSWIRIRIHSKMSWIRNTAGRNRKSLAIFSSLLLKNANNTRMLIFKLCLPQDLKIYIISQSSPKNKPLCIIQSFYKKWSQNAWSKLDYQPFICVTYVCMEVTEPSGRPPKKKKIRSKLDCPAPDNAWRCMPI
jgi:hypothetical protein